MATAQPARNRETEATKALYGIGDSTTDGFGRQCLLARKFVEAGVRFVEITSGQWDHHRDLKNALGKVRRLLRQHLLPGPRRKLQPTPRSQSTESLCADFTCIIRNSRKSWSITFAIWRIRRCLLSMPKLRNV